MLEVINIGIVEDDAIYRESLEDLIEGMPQFNCLFAVNSSEKAHKLISDDCIPEVILHDIDLPIMSGIESCVKIKELSPSTHIIMLTIFDEDDKVFDAILNGAEGYLLKSSSTEKILEGIIDVVKGGAAMTPQIASKVLRVFTKNNAPKKDYGLTKRQIDILKSLTDGLNKHQIAEKLFISHYTVETHLKNIYVKLHVHTQMDLMSKIYKENIV